MLQTASRRRAIEIVSFDDTPVHWIRYRNAARGGGSTTEMLEVRRARVLGLPDRLDAIVATSGLQGVVHDPRTGEPALLGLAVAEALEALAFDGQLPPAACTGVITAM